MSLCLASTTADGITFGCLLTDGHKGRHSNGGYEWDEWCSVREDGHVCALERCDGVHHECDPELCGAAWHVNTFGDLVYDRLPHSLFVERDPLDGDPLLDDDRPVVWLGADDL